MAPYVNPAVVVDNAGEPFDVESSPPDVLSQTHNSRLPALTAGFGAGMGVLAFVAFAIWFQRRSGLAEELPMPAGPPKAATKAEGVLDKLPNFTTPISQATTATPPPPTPPLSPTADTTLSLPSPMELDDHSPLIIRNPSSNVAVLSDSYAKANQLIHLTPLPSHNSPPVRQECYDHQPCSDHVVHVVAPVDEMEKAYQEWRRLESARGKWRDRAIVVIGTSASVVMTGAEVVNSCEDSSRVVVGERSEEMDGKVGRGHVKKDSGVDGCW